MQTNTFTETKTPAWTGSPRQSGIRPLADVDNVSFENLNQIYIYLRSTKKLFNKSEIMFEGYPSWTNLGDKLSYVFTVEGFASMKHINILINGLIRKGVGPEITYEDRLTVFNIGGKKKDRPEDKLAKNYLKEGARLTRAACWQWRLETAIKEAVKDGWFPMFGTYTVDPAILAGLGLLTRDELWTKTSAWDIFVKRFKRATAEACGYGRRETNWPKGNTFFKYFGLIEHGSGDGNHPHIHVIWLCRNIPKEWKHDPNRNCRDNTLVDIVAASALWDHGIQRKTMALFIVGSWFTSNWVVPRRMINGKLEPRKVGDAGSVAGYIGKYITKGATRKWNHRIKATKGLGLETLVQNVQNKCPTQILISMCQRPMDYAISMKIQQKTAIPLSLLRKISKKVLLRQLHSCNSLRAKRFLWTVWTKNPNTFYMNYINAARDGAKVWSMMPQQRYNFVTQILEEVASTVHCKKRVLNFCNWLEEHISIKTNCERFTLLKGET